MGQKFFFFDIDGTLAVWPDGRIPENTQYCLEELQRQGHRVALATGRIQMDAARFAERTGLVDFVADGGHSVTVNKKLIEMDGLPHEECLTYLAHLEEKGIPWAVTDHNELTRVTPYQEILNWHPDWDVFETIVDPSYDYRKAKEIFKIYAFFKPGEEEEKEIIHMSDKLIRYGEGCILFEPMDKARGIHRMIEHYGFERNQVVVFGDGFNDLSMFHPQWLNIAMGNGRNALKAAADYVTDRCDNDGILKACQHFGWVK